MTRRSLLDYLAEDGASDQSRTGPNVDAAKELERRLAELESRFAAAMRPDEPAAPDNTFSAQIEAILKRRGAASDRAASAPVTSAPRERPRLEIKAPPLVPELPLAEPDSDDDFFKFVEAVHLIGLAASRFLHTPVASRPLKSARQAEVSESNETIRLTLMLNEAVATFQAMASELAGAVGEIRQATTDTALPAPPRQAPPQRTSGEDEDILRLRDELDDLRERLAAMTRRGMRDGY
jgi:hypothetical protein